MLGGFDYRTWLSGAKLEGVFGTNPDRVDELKRALIGLLMIEQAKREAERDELRRTGRARPEEYSDYYGDLILAVAALKDPRSIKALLGAITSGGAAGGALADFGPLALNGVLAKSQSPDALERSMALGVLSAMLSPKSERQLDEPGRQRTRSSILQAAADEEWDVRAQAARILGAMPPDVETIAILRQLAESDPAVSSGHFPVRQAATQALRQIESRTTPETQPAR